MNRYQGTARNKTERIQRVKLYVGGALNHTGWVDCRTLAFGLCAMIYLAVR